MSQKHCYLFALEIAPLKVGEIYNELPLHCTLMHRFWSELSPDALAEKVAPYFATISPVSLIPYEHLLLGPKQVPVSELKLTEQIKNLHLGLYELLNGIKVEYTAPEWVGAGYRPHVTEIADTRLEVGSVYVSSAAYLIEAEMPEAPHARQIRHVFAFQQPSR